MRKRPLLLAVLMGLAGLAGQTPSWGQPPATAALSSGTLGVNGQVLYYSNQSAVDGVTMTLQGPTVLSTATDSAGSFTFAGISADTWTLQPQKQSPAGLEISALDAVYALASAAQLMTLTPEQAIACDVTGNGSVSALDAALILQ